jgi:hypothetical protein
LICVCLDAWLVLWLLGCDVVLCVCYAHTIWDVSQCVHSFAFKPQRRFSNKAMQGMFKCMWNVLCECMCVWLLYWLFDLLIAWVVVWLVVGLTAWLVFDWLFDLLF